MTGFGAEWGFPAFTAVYMYFFELVTKYAPPKAKTAPAIKPKVNLSPNRKYAQTKLKIG